MMVKFLSGGGSGGWWIEMVFQGLNLFLLYIVMFLGLMDNVVVSFFVLVIFIVSLCF